MFKQVNSRLLKFVEEFESLIIVFKLFDVALAKDSVSNLPIYTNVTSLIYTKLIKEGA